MTPATAAPVQNLAASVDANNVTLTWDAPAEGNPIAYVVKRDGVVIGEVTELTYLDEHLAWETTYTYNIIARYTEGESLPVAVTATVGVDGIEENALTVGVYPNPTDGILNIVTNAENYEYQVINCVGQIVLNGNANGKTTINVSELSGVYFLRIVTDGDILVRKITVK